MKKHAEESFATQTSTEVITAEISRIPKDHMLLESEDYAVMYARAYMIPNILYEIGRLREKTLRQVGESAGKSVDLDHFDLYYVHRFVWNEIK